MELSISQDRSGEVAVVRVAGRFDAHQAPQVRRWLLERRQQGVNQIVVNLEAVTFVDSTALAALVIGLKHSREAGGDLHLCGLEGPVTVIFDLTRMDRVFPIYRNETEAVAAFRMPAAA